MRLGRFLVEQLSSAITAVVFSIRHATEGTAQAKETHVYEVDCARHGRTWLVRSRQTACCASMQWVPSGRVTSRITGGAAAEVVFR